MKPRLLYVITLAEMGGAQNHVLDLVESFKDTFDVEVATSGEGYLTERLSDIGVVWHLVPEMKRSVAPLNDLKAIKVFRALLRERKVCLVHAHSAKAGLIARIAAKAEGVRSIYSVHGWAFDKGTGLLRKMVVWPVEFFAARFTDQLVTPSEHDKQKGCKALMMKADRITVIPYGIADLEGRASAQAPDGGPVVIMPARFTEQKDQETLIRAAATLTDVRFQIWLIGDGPKRERCEALAKQLGVAEKITFLGTRRDLNDLLLTANVFCLTTHYEGFPLTILEAMRCSLPVVASDVSGISEGITHGETGILVGHSDLNDVAHALKALVTDESLRMQMGVAGRDRFERNYARAIMHDRMNTLYMGMIGEAAS